jgi:hypothetical protein
MASKKIKRLVVADLNARFLILAQQYNVQFFDDEVLDEDERDSDTISFRIRVQGVPTDPNTIIPAILPEVQAYIRNNYSAYSIDNITFDNFNPQNAEKSQRFPNTIDFYFSTKFSFKGA